MVEAATAVKNTGQELIKSYGPVKIINLDSGETLTILPTNTTPLAHLIKSNWESTTQMGNVRSVRSVDRVSCGADPGLVVKSPERFFTASIRQIDKGEIWWGGPKSGERRVRIDTEPLVEEQSVWEAAFLMELNSKGIPVEVPQALIRDQQGRYELVVERIDSVGRREYPVASKQSGALIAEKTNLTPIDSSGFNHIRDSFGVERVIDVNRWLWKPHTDEYRDQLAALIKRTVLAYS